MKILIVATLMIIFTACTQQSETLSNQKPQLNKKNEMSKDCQEYFDGLKELAKENQNLSNKFGDKISSIDTAWQSLSNIDRIKFSDQCPVRNKQLQEMKGTPELEKLLNEL